MSNNKTTYLSGQTLNGLCPKNCDFEVKVSDGGHEVKIQLHIIPLAEDQIVPLQIKDVSL